MARSSSWSKLLRLHAHDMPAGDYLETLLALRPVAVRQSVARIIQHEGSQAAQQLPTLGLHHSIADVLIALTRTDPSFVSLPTIIDQAIDEAVKSKLGTALRIETAESLTAAAKASILDGLKSRFPEPMVVDVSINPSFIGGGRVQIGSLQIDLSTKTQLTRLRQAVQA